MLEVPAPVCTLTGPSQSALRSLTVKDKTSEHGVTLSDIQSIDLPMVTAHQQPPSSTVVSSLWVLLKLADN